MLPVQPIVLPTKSTHEGNGDGGISVNKQMQEILDQPGYLSFKMGSKTLRELYSSRSSSFDPLKLTYFGLCCYIGEYDKVVKEVESGCAPDLEGTETPYKWGYLTIVISGAQDLEPNPQHIKVLKYLISRGAPVDLPDITGNTALFHGTMNHRAKLDMSRVLLESGSDPNLRNRYGEVPLLLCFQSNVIGAIDLLMEFGANIYIADADGVTPRYFQPETFRGRKTDGDQGMRILQEVRRRRCSTEAVFKVSDCEVLFDSVSAYVAAFVAYYASLTFHLGSHWRTHKPLCQPFSLGNTVTLIPYYDPQDGILVSVAGLYRDLLSTPTPDTTQSPHRLGHARTPKNTSADSLKSIVIKVQVRVNPFSRRHIPDGDLLVYAKKRDFVCKIRRVDGPEEFDRLFQVVRTKGVGGTKAYFAAELRGKTALIVKVPEVLAEQPF
ncbi:ankyrin repeat-containing domain protein [Armillaria fumosa]|nr:ankyrin repeat-containing domain protein [Armillaria fumosa]